MAGEKVCVSCRPLFLFASSSLPLYLARVVCLRVDCEQAIELGRFVERSLRESRAIETEGLCIMAGEKVCFSFRLLFMSLFLFFSSSVFLACGVAKTKCAQGAGDRDVGQIVERSLRESMIEGLCIMAGEKVRFEPLNQCLSFSRACLSRSVSPSLPLFLWTQLSLCVRVCVSV